MNPRMKKNQILMRKSKKSKSVEVFKTLFLTAYLKMHIIEKIEEIAKKYNLKSYQMEELIQVSKWAYPTQRWEAIKKKLKEWDISPIDVDEK